MARQSTVTKEKLLAATAVTIVKWGLRKTTLDDIGKAAGVSKAAVLYHFHSKEELVAAVVDAEHQRFLTALRESVGKETTAEGRLRTFALVRFQYITERLHDYGDVAKELIESVMPLVRASEARYREEELTLLRAILTEGMAAGELAPGDPDLIAAAAMAALSGLYEGFMLYDRGDQVGAGIEQLFHLLMDGLRRR
jgi:AcrR family transcriptional regulator